MLHSLKASKCLATWLKNFYYKSYKLSGCEAEHEAVSLIELNTKGNRGNFTISAANTQWSFRYMEVLEENLTKNSGIGEKSVEDQVEKFIYDATWDMSLGFPEINK